MVRDALMQPVRKVLSATHFKPVPVKSPEGQDVVKWTPCSPGDPKAQEKTWNDVSSEELLEPPLVVSIKQHIRDRPRAESALPQLNDFLRAVQAVRPSVAPESIKAHLTFAAEAGAVNTHYFERRELTGDDHTGSD